MKFTTTQLAAPQGFSNQRIEGTTPDGLPFVAFCFQAPRAKVRLSLAFDSTRKPVSKFATDASAFAALNGGFYTLDKGHPLDWFVMNGATVTPLSNSARPCIRIRNGEAALGSPTDPEPGEEVLQAGPLLLRGGTIVQDYSDFQEKAKQFDADITANRYPRSVFGVSDGAYFFMTVDGRCDASVGLYLQECAEVIGSLGATDAMNLDGGGSSMLVVDGKLINNPRTWMNQPEPAERPIPTAILVHLR